MKDTKFAELDHEKIGEIKQLEQKLNVTLIAYDISPSSNLTQHEDTPVVINPS